MKRENHNKCYRARAVTLIIVFKNIYQIFRPITLLKHMYQSICATNYCLINCVINTVTTFLRRTLYYAYSRLKNFGRYNAKTYRFPILLNEGETCFP